MKTALRLLGFMKPFLGEVLLSVLLGVATVASGIGLLGTSAYLVTRAALHPSIAVLEVAIVGVRFFGIVRSVFRYLERLVSHSVNFRLLAKIRVWFYRALEPLAPARLLDYRSGDILNRIVGDIDTLENFYIRVMAPPLVALLVIAGITLFTGCFSMSLAWVLTGGMLLDGIGVPILTYLMGRRSGSLLVDLRAELSESVVDGIQGMSELIAFGQVGMQELKVKSLINRLGRAQNSLAWAGGVSNALNLMLSQSTLVGVLLLAIPLVNRGQLDGWNLAVLALVTLACFEAVTPLGSMAQNLVSSLQAAQRLFTLVDIAPSIQEAANPNSLPGFAQVDIHNLYFRYAPELPLALENFSLTLLPGKRVAVVGESGAGKTTIVNLLLRFWDYQDGLIELDGRDIRGYSSGDVRQNISVISQSTYLFSTTVRENLLLVCPDAGETDLLDVIHRVSLGGWLSTLPEGLDTWIGENGVQMSGGERQRLAAARAILQRTSLLILDEPAVHLDPMAEKDLLQILLEETSGRTVLWITHHLVDMEKMDEIVLLKGGKTVERGTHVELLRIGGYYARMWQMQNKEQLLPY